ncbi:hypothetical protein CUZ56_01348 [Saezia sanguinis]|uniref:TraG N-terminal Proteobacteria domain-containing protein n=1 Tax=Saezia sanguinis TaxID=1965230 RepID=A0A433SF80_9BURK|nr:conjugal transfer protein TraG N-terminal domain-containing protein [Saezia sanguinis]RUS67403.1 hypothetical protein CUZ56_01348 [Saezia sanguinis]
MTLYTADYLEYYLTLASWIISNGIWNVLVASGVFAIPFLTIVLQEWLKARNEGADEGNKGALSAVRIENRLYVAIVVIMFAGIPFIDVDLTTIKYDESRSQQCQALVAKPQETQWDNVFSTINDQSAKLPVWWFFMHSLSRAVTSAAVASIPCGTDLRQMRMDINHARIADPVLAQEVADFTHNCYGPARAKLFMSRPELDKNMMNDVSWIGSHYFLETTGFYDTFRSKTARAAWPYDSTRDAGLAQVMHGGGYPTCYQWWLDANIGLRARLVQQVSPDLLDRFGKWIGYLSQDEVNDEIVRAIASPAKQTVNDILIYNDYGGQVDMSLVNTATRLTAEAGLVVGSISYFPSMDAVRQALPVILSFLKMGLVICIPILLVVGVYDLKNLVTVSVIQFALFFVDFWFQLARWIDSTILDALYGSNSPHHTWNPVIGLNNHFQDMMLNFVMAAMFIVLPMFWITSLGWVGAKVGMMLHGLTTGTTGIQQSGSKSGGIISSVITKK